MKRFSLALVMTLVPGFLCGQEATITINGYAYGQIAGISHECPLKETGQGWRVEGYVGLQVSCPVWAVDAEDFFTPASMSVMASDSSRVSAVIVHSIVDTAGQYAPDTLKIQVLRRGNWSIDLYANPILFIMGYMNTRTSDAIWPQHEFPTIRAVVGEDFILCAYEGGYEDAVAKSYNRPTACPDLGDTALPEFEVTWVLPEILGGVLADISPNLLLAGVRDGRILPKWTEQTLHPVPLTFGVVQN